VLRVSWGGADHRGSYELELFVLIDNLHAILVMRLGRLVADARKVAIHDVCSLSSPKITLLPACHNRGGVEVVDLAKT
jgi:hypothetical protein